MADVERIAFKSPQATADIEESTMIQPKASRRTKCIKVAVCILALFMMDAVMFTAMDLTLLRVRKPNYRLKSVAVGNLRVSNSTAQPSFHMQLNPQIILRNRNFGSYKFHDGNLTFSYGGKPAGIAFISESIVNLRSTKMMEIFLNVSSEAAWAWRNSSLGKDIVSGLVNMSVDSDLRGQVRFFKVYPKDKSAKMKCDLTVNLMKRVVQDLRCD
ncbi:hypothetical protein M9H77_26607 [Catharanthus roseus]|uniref:Uncharacterized protein n=1 Tax=Catharanthus roseus TaxID=4058 RepID=A0ACC0AB18_CATRO|nr:hypothetical protein M9H77_26607 [Catharanthus roseus]